MIYALFVFFFFSSRRRHTRLQGDWSSDVCSSDLRISSQVTSAFAVRDQELLRSLVVARHRSQAAHRSCTPPTRQPIKIGRASCRERVEMAGGDVTVEGDKSTHSEV